jgi:hypothetical protein
MTLGLVQAAAEYMAIVASQAVAVAGSVVAKTVAFVGTPRGVIVGSIAAIFLALSLGWRRPPRM